MRSYDEALAAARDRPAFSNSDGYTWVNAWCGTCLHDKGARAAETNGITDADVRGMGLDPAGCPLLGLSLIARRTPAEWLEQEWPVAADGRRRPPAIEDTYHCTEYSHDPDTDTDDGPDDDGPPPDPGPPPVCDGQVDMFEIFVDLGLDEITAREQVPA